MGTAGRGKGDLGPGRIEMWREGEVASQAGGRARAELGAGGIFMVCWEETVKRRGTVVGEWRQSWSLNSRVKKEAVFLRRLKFQAPPTRPASEPRHGEMSADPVASLFCLS